jgi:hypothetical protein
MYLAPLNYDRFFKKTFSNLDIAKRFLEDFLDINIESIELLPNRHKVTNEAMVVEFDYRCKVDGKFMVIDMQQWYKTDVVKRFYLYHALNSVLQLESITPKSIPISKNKKKETPNYDGLEPVHTLIWFADDSLGFKEDFVSFSLLPDDLMKFIQAASFWENNNSEASAKERKRILDILSNKTKQIDFLSKNKLVYIFQKNIVKNQSNSKYFAWFEFAEKTKDENNVKDDFEKYETDKIFKEIMKRINKEALQEEDFQYITDYAQFREEFRVHEESVYKNAWREGNEIGKELGYHQATFEFIKVLWVEFESISRIARFTRLTIPQVQQYMKNIPDKETFELVEKQWNEHKNIQDIVKNIGVLEGTVQRIVTYILDYQPPQADENLVE